MRNLFWHYEKGTDTYIYRRTLELANPIRSHEIRLTKKEYKNLTLERKKAIEKKVLIELY